jgi:Chitin synthase
MRSIHCYRQVKNWQKFELKCLCDIWYEGLMVWYQKFEYAISHWLQKSTEHVLGCVLCSPGCFSLFRGSALMDDNVMKTYSKLPEEASQYVQYEQGETSTHIQELDQLSASVYTQLLFQACNLCNFSKLAPAWYHFDSSFKVFKCLCDARWS